MKIFCPHCGVKGTADKSYIGKMVKCPKCEASFEVSPGGETSLPEDEQVSVSIAPLKVDSQNTDESRDGIMLKILCPHCGVKGTADQSYIGKMVKCPKCEVAFEVFSEGKICLSEDVQVSAASSSLEPEVQDIIGSSKEMIQAVDDKYASVSLEEDEGEPAAEIPAECVPEDEFSGEPEKPEEVLEWSDITDDPDPELIEVGETVEEVLPEEQKNSPPGEGGGITDSPPVLGDVASTLRARGFQGNDPELTDSSSVSSEFSIIDVIKDAWEGTKGAKASIWAGSCVMYLVMLIIGGAGIFLMPIMGFDLTATTGVVINVVGQVFLTVLSIVFTAGLLYMGVRKVAGDPISWDMIFSGFSFTGQIILATLLQTIFVGLGLLLLVLPGIYLIVGYGLTLPLILDRKMSAWEAMETSRKAIHKVWWKVAGALFLMGCLYTVSAIPLGIGLIWTVPMFIILGGVVYRCLFGVRGNS